MNVLIHVCQGRCQDRINHARGLLRTGAEKAGSSLPTIGGLALKENGKEGCRPSAVPRKPWPDQWEVPCNKVVHREYPVSD